MEKLRLLTFLILSVLIIPLVSCDDDDDETDPTRTAILTAREWTGHSLYADGQEITEEVSENVDFDITQEKLKFNTDGTYLDTYGTSTLSGTWIFVDNEQKITFDQNTADEYTVSIGRLTDSELYLIYPGHFFSIPTDVEARFDR